MHIFMLQHTPVDEQLLSVIDLKVYDGKQPCSQMVLVYE